MGLFSPQQGRTMIVPRNAPLRRFRRVSIAPRGAMPMRPMSHYPQYNLRSAPNQTLFRQPQQQAMQRAPQRFAVRPQQPIVKPQPTLFGGLFSGLGKQVGEMFSLRQTPVAQPQRQGFRKINISEQLQRNAIRDSLTSSFFRR